MKVHQIYTGCLAQGAYYVESEGEAAIIDPLRETNHYLELAKQNQVVIKYIFETHFHADFVSGHLDLAEKTGAQIVYGPGAETKYEKHTAQDGEIFNIGKAKIKVLHTPGHTLESSCYLLFDEEGVEHALFTGDTLFIGDVGRPDLAQKNTDLSKEQLAEMLYESLHSKIMPLPDHVIIYPAHGAGSACGKNMSKETTDTLGNQKENNYALQPDLSKDDFIEQVLEGLLPPPNYFSENVKLNKSGYDSFDDVLKRSAKPLSPEEFEWVANSENALILDVRSKEAFVKGFIPNSIFIGLDGSFAPWVGALIPDLKQPILLVAPVGREEEAITRLSRVGYDQTLGYLEGGFRSWENYNGEIDSIETLDGPTFAQQYNADQDDTILDVRKPDEFASGHLLEAQSFPLDFINQKMHEVRPQQPYYIHCQSGYRSTIAASILKARGFAKLKNIQHPFPDLEKHGLKIATSQSQVH